MEYRVIRSNRRTVALHITADGSLEVRCPFGMPGEEIRRFVKSKERWIQKHRRSDPGEKLTQAQLETLTRQAGEVFPEVVSHFAPLVGVTWGRITVRHQKTRWGSCSAAGNLNFNCLLLLAPPEVLEYVVIHELCHRKQMNHSKAFWALVEACCPGYRDHRKWLRQNGHSLIARLP